MATTYISSTSPEGTHNATWFWKKLCLSPWGVVAILQLPYALLYLYYLWPHTHYQFSPLLAAAIGYFIHSRFGLNQPTPRLDWAAFLFGTTGIVLAVAATCLVSAWLGYLGFVFTLAAGLSKFSDRADGRSLMYLAWPLTIAWQPPFNDLSTGDTVLITYLQQCSGRFASSLLDVLGVTHFFVGNVIELPDKSFSIEEGCSGVQSFFAILCVAALMAVAFRRGIMHSALLFSSGVFWTILMNTLRITLIPLAAMASGIDLSHGTPHQVLGFAAMGLATWMLLSTDQFLLHWLQRTGPGSAPAQAKTASNLTPGTSMTAGSAWTRPWIAVCCLVGVLAVVQVVDLQKKTFRLFGGNVFLDLHADDLPTTLGKAALIDHRLERRATGADFGERSDIWRYAFDSQVVTISLDQTFRLWHDLIVCYKNAGWQLQSERIVFGDDPSWPIVLATFERSDGHHGLLAFCFFDRSGLPLEVPGYLDLWTSIKSRLHKRFTPAAGELFREQTCYQVQAFAQSESGFSETRQAEILTLLESGRQAVRDAGLKRLEP